MSVNTLLFPSDYFSDKMIDPDLKKEYDAVMENGQFNVVLFSYDKWFNENKLLLNKNIYEPCNAIYRGWMMKPEKYSEFYYNLKSKNIFLVTSPEEYERFHIFPNIYEKIYPDTAEMIIYPQNAKIDLTEIKNKFNKFMIKDFVKSVKGTDFPKFFDRSVTEEEFQKQMEIFYRYRGDLFTGGICVKEFLDLKKYGDKTNEYRVFYGNGEIISISRNSGQSPAAPLPPRKLTEKYRVLHGKYYTVDYAEISDGSWKILEAGDGQVSGLSDGQDHNAYFRALYHCFNK